MVQSQQVEDLTIGKFAATANVGVETIRFYQRIGLLGTPKRIDGIRRYGANDVQQLRFIRRAQTAGFTLEEIGRLLLLDKGEDRATVLALASERLRNLDEKIAELQAVRASLEHLVEACAAGGKGSCPILKSFEV
jgi:MerR family transcriptional regulator, mercuric resistance operon regulatory protein